MYFITNNEDYVVAASKSLLDKIGYSDVCSISLALKNKEIIILEDDELKIRNLDSNFKYSLVELHSAFGKLNLYNLSLANDSDDSIEYLKKIKEGLVQTQDNEFDIPEIKKDITKEDATQIEKLEQLILDTKDEDIATVVKEEPKEAIKEEDETLDVVRIFGNKDTQESESEEKVELKDYIQDDNNLEKVVEESSTQDNKNSSSNDALLDLINKEVAKESEEELINNKVVEIKEPEEEKEETSKETKKGLSKITSKLFPWGSKESSSDIELEDESSIKTTEELISKVEPKEAPVIDKDKEIIVEEVEEPKDNIIEIEEEETFEEEPVEKEVQEAKDSSIKKDIDSSLETTTLYKLIEIQVNSIDINENANKLSIDTDNYKLLLDNYLDEIDNYKDDLLNDNKSTIDMLIDASNLLSLDIITKRLQQQPNETALKELFVITKLIRQKLNSNELELQENRVKEVTGSDFEDVEVSETTPPSIPQDMIDITSSENLLKSIPAQRVEFNPQKASDELNLPKSLIIEFVNDFTKQAKEHLPQLVQGYKNDDIKTLQTTAHMLKGAASNLRLDEIAQTLFKIQKENSLSKSGELIKEFVAQLKGLENELKKMESMSNED